MKSIFLLGITTTLLFAFAGCSKDSDDDGTPVYPNVVRISNSGFSPSTVEIQRTSTVTWVNDDNAVHRVTADAAEFESPDIVTGKIYTIRFDVMDTVAYHCKYHPAEKGVVIVNAVR